MSIKAHFRYRVRQLAYSRLVEPVSLKIRQRLGKTDAIGSNSTTEKWDQDLSGRFSSYIEPTQSVQAIALKTGLLASWLLPDATSALDLGCGGGYLGAILKSHHFSCYRGVDISSVAVRSATEQMNKAREDYPENCRFEVGSLEDYVPERANDQDNFDLIVFSEVLYYMPEPEDSVRVVERFSKWLSKNGAIAISLKDDGKSHAILRRLSKSFHFRESALLQMRAGYSGHRVVIDAKNPASVITLIVPKKGHKSKP